MATKILWFSRHTMTSEQSSALESKLSDITILQVNGSPANVHVPFEGEVNGVKTQLLSVKDVAKDCDILAIVCPINMQEQFLRIAEGRPVIIAQTKRELVKSDDGSEDKVNFIFNGWKQLKKIEIVLEDFA